jgi:hypothetical protein
MGLIEIGWEGVDRINLADCRNRWQILMNVAMNLQVA